MTTKTGTPMCPKCAKTMKANPHWYQCEYYIVAGDSGQCLTHPVITNPRVVRTVKPPRAWSLDPAGTKMAVGPPTHGMGKVVMHLGGGHIHERNAYLSLFDYERPFVDLLVNLGYVSRHKGTPTTPDREQVGGRTDPAEPAARRGEKRQESAYAVMANL